MSWSGFKKNVGRATTQVMMKTGHVEKTSDREYEVEERRYRTLESASLRLQKEAKGYLDSLRAMTASQMRIAETIDAFYGDSGAKDGVSRSYKQAVEDLDAETVKALDGPYRCVPISLSSRYPTLHKMVPPSPWEGDSQDEYARDVLKEVEQDLNFKSGIPRNYTQSLEEGVEAEMLIESVYRTTVLEPINRFCAYFPDINECIKKRNHKMLDYDSMRSKVKKLTEKPDKDPAKLPRTEKETEMVKSTYPRSSMNSDDTIIPFPDFDKDCLTLPSPPRIFNEPKQRSPDPLARIRADEDAALQIVGLRRRTSSNTLRRATRAGAMLHNAFWGLQSEDLSPSAERLLRFPSGDGKERKYSKISTRDPFDSNLTPLPERSPGLALPLGVAWSGVAKPSPSPCKPKGKKAAHRRPTDVSTGASFTQPTATLLGSESPVCWDVAPSLRTTSFEKCTPTNTARSGGGWFTPSELEDVMRPLKQEYIQKHTDLLLQAKAAYEQINQQLTDELPQLIDLRVPYLDPSFEALVKIQLRFCAEAYSRMAQVQQYLDASTRDQYASGDLDARVEDVLGQIRELSIAGTV